MLFPFSIIFSCTKYQPYYFPLHTEQLVRCRDLKYTQHLLNCDHGIDFISLKLSKCNFLHSLLRCFYPTPTIIMRFVNEYQQNQINYKVVFCLSTFDITSFEIIFELPRIERIDKYRPYLLYTKIFIYLAKHRSTRHTYSQINPRLDISVNIDTLLFQQNPKTVNSL